MEKKIYLELELEKKQENIQVINFFFNFILLK